MRARHGVEEAEPARAAQIHTGTRQGQFLAGDAVRGIAMTCVIVLHLAGGSLVLTNAYSSKSPFASYGAVPGTAMYGLELAVPMFFVLSGYLISGPWIRAYVLGKPAPSVRRYLRNRAVRIVPVFWLLSALMLLLYGASGSSGLDIATIFAFGQIYHKSGAEAFLSQAWSIDVEVGFYLVVPAVALLLTFATRRIGVRIGRDLGPRGRVGLVLVLLAVVALASAWLRATTYGTLWTDSPPATLYSFVPGIALATLELRLAGSLAHRRPRLLAPVLGLCAMLLGAAVVVATSTDSIAMVRARGELAVVAVCGLALAALLVRQLVRGDSPRWVDNRVTRWLGARSYPCYIVQSATITSGIFIVGRVGGGPWIEFLVLTALVLPLTFAAGALVHAAVERPVLAWGRARTPRVVVRRPEGPVDAVVPDQHALVASVRAATQDA